MNQQKDELQVSYDRVSDPHDHLSEIFNKLFSYSTTFYTVVSGVMYTTVSGVRPAIFA